MGILVVDGANVVGSRPDGWWRDREGAARRLHLALVDADLGFDEVVLVLEGKARFQPDAGHTEVAVVNAPASGDDAVVEWVVAAGADPSTAGSPSPTVVVVTADRGLRSRLASTGAECVGPSWLLEQVTYGQE